MNKIYLVKYYGGGYDDHYTVTIFATTKKATATKYVRRFNKILKKWKEYYSQFEEDKYGIMKWLKEDYTEQYFYRWNSLRNITKCYYEEVPVR
jgi:hypothetical protein